MMKRTVYIFNNQISIHRFKKERQFLNKDYFSDNIEVYTREQFIRHEVELFWTLLGKCIRPNVINRSTSIFILKNIVERKRIHDGSFLYFNAKDDVIAEKMYYVMEKSEKNHIPVEEVFPRITRFKIKKSKDIYTEILDAIREYKKILSEKNIIDVPMLYSYFDKLISTDRYMKEVENIEFFEVVYIHKDEEGRSDKEKEDSYSLKDEEGRNNKEKEDSYSLKDEEGRNNKEKEDSYSLKDEEGRNNKEKEVSYSTKYRNFDIINTSYRKVLFENVDEYKDVDCSIKFDVSQYNTYFEALSSLEKYLIEKKEALVVVPNITKDIKGVIKSLNTFNLKAGVFRDELKARFDRTLMSAFCAYKLMYYHHILNKKLEINDDNIDFFVEMVMYLYDSGYCSFDDFVVCNHFNYTTVRSRINEILSYILANDVLIFSDRFKNASEFGDNVDVCEFIKAFSRYSRLLNDDTAEVLSRVCDVFDDISSVYGREVDEIFNLSIMEYIIGVFGINSSSRKCCENLIFNDIVFISLYDYLNLPYGSENMVFFDFTSSRLDMVIEKFIDTDLAYLDDDTLSTISTYKGEIVDDSLVEFANIYTEKLEINRFLKFKNKLVADGIKEVYFIGSYLSISGYDQENKLSRYIMDNGI